MDINQLSDDERAALFYHLLYRTHSRKSHPELFEAPFWLSSFYRRMGQGEEGLKEKEILNEDLNLTDLAYEILPANNARKMLKELRDEVLKLEAAKNHLGKEISFLKTKIAEFNPRTPLERMVIPQQARNYIDKAFSRIDEGSFSDAIMNCYRVSEVLAKNLFSLLYPGEKNKRVKHEDKLKKIWTDEETEKKRMSGIRVIASLLAVVLWYRNKMGAHTEMAPTKEAARTCAASLIQALIEFERLGMKISWQF